jgi:restriction endonuclease S subunit
VSEWKEIKLKQLVKTMGDGGTPSTLNEGNFNGNIPWVVIDDIKSEIYDTKDKLTESGFRSCSAKLWDVETIILSTGATIGLVGIAKVPLCTKQGITGIVVNEHANNLFIKYWFEYNTNLLLRFSQGTTFKEIRTRPLGNLRIKVPEPFTKESLSEQEAIVSIINQSEKAIDAALISINALQRVKNSMMQNLLQGLMKPEGNYRSVDDFYIDPKYGKIPIGWRSVKLKEITISEGTYGANASAINFDPDKPRFIRITDIDEFGLLIQSERASVELVNEDSYLLNHNDILLARTGDTVGKSLLYKESMGKAVYAGYLIRFQVNTSMMIPDLFELILHSDVFRAFIISMKRVGAKPNINAREYANFRFILPNTIDEQNSILERFNPVQKAIDSKKMLINDLMKLKVSLIQNLISGKLLLSSNQISGLKKLSA